MHIGYSKQLSKTEIIPTLFAVTRCVDFIFKLILEKTLNLAFHSHVGIVFYFNVVWEGVPWWDYFFVEATFS